MPLPNHVRASAGVARGPPAAGAGRAAHLSRSGARGDLRALAESVPRGLSMLGISWGIVSVVMLLAYGNGFRTRSRRGFANAFGNGVASCGPARPACRPAASAPAAACG